MVSGEKSGKHMEKMVVSMGKGLGFHAKTFKTWDKFGIQPTKMVV